MIKKVKIMLFLEEKRASDSDATWDLWVTIKVPSMYPGEGEKKTAHNSLSCITADTTILRCWS